MKHILVFALCAFVLVPMAFAAPMSTVTVDSSGGGNFLALQPAMDSFCTGGANAAAAPPFTINIVPQPTPYDEILSLNDDVFVAANGASQELVGDLTIQSSIPATDAWVAVQENPATDPDPNLRDGFLIYQSNHDVTVIDLLLTPSVALPASAPSDDLVKVDENAENQPSAMNTTTFSGCVFSDLASPSMTPMVTDRAGWITMVGGDHPSTTDGFATAWGGSGSGCLKFWGDAGESASYVVEDCVMYNAGHCLQCVPENDGESASVTGLFAASYLTWNSPVYIGCGDGATGSTYMGGTDSTDINTSVALFSRGWHTCNVYKSDTKPFTIEHVRAYGDSDTASHCRGFSMAGAGPCANFNDVIVATDYFVMMVRADSAMTLDRCTLHTIEAGDNIINQYLAGTGSLTATDCIFTGPGDLAGGTGTFAGGFNIDYSVVCQNGPDALGSIVGGGTPATIGINCTFVDPAYLNTTDITSPNFFAVDNAQLATMSSGSGPLRGGGLWVGSGIPVELSIFSTN